MRTSSFTKCSQCNTLLSSNDDQPYHNCGQTVRNIHIFAEDKIDMEDRYVIQSTSGKTNRSTIHAASENPTDTVELHKLIISYVEHETTDLASFIDRLVKNFNTVLYLDSQTFFKGVDISVKEQLKSKQIGPAPDPGNGRYNRPCEKCIYLTDNIAFLHTELNKLDILVQEYDIPVNKYKIADLSPGNESLHNSLALVFDMAESGRTSLGYFIENELEIRGKSMYLVSQLLASFFKRYGWDGIYIPGVHGGQGCHYHNLAIFSTIIDEWETWTKGEYFRKQKS